MERHIAIAQIRPRKADYEANLARIGDLFEQVTRMTPPPDVLVLPETALSGYFLEGGVREIARSRHVVFADLQRTYRRRAPAGAAPLDVLVGFYEMDEGKCYNSGLYATLTVGDVGSVEAGVLHVHHKMFLPTYGVFDENRFVSKGRTIDVFDTRFGRASILICEDVWHSMTSAVAALKGAQTLYVISASPGREFAGQNVGSLERWRLLLPGIASEHGLFVVYAGLVGFEGGKGFTGTSCVVSPWGEMVVSGPPLEECVVTACIDDDDVAIARTETPLISDLEAALPDLALELEAIARAPHVARSV